MNKSEISKSLDVKQQSIHPFHLYNYNITYRYDLGCVISIDHNFNILLISGEPPYVMGENYHDSYNDLTGGTLAIDRCLETIIQELRIVPRTY